MNMRQIISDILGLLGDVRRLKDQMSDQQVKLDQETARTNRLDALVTGTLVPYGKAMKQAIADLKAQQQNGQPLDFMAADKAQDQLESDLQAATTLLAPDTPATTAAAGAIEAPVKTATSGQ